VLGAGHSGQLDTIHTGGPKSVGRGSQRRTRGDDIVDHEDRQTVPRLPGAKCRTDEALGAGFAGLWRAMGAVQEPAARNTELAGHRAGYRLGLVVAASPDPAGAGRRPRDEIDVGELQPTHHVSGQHAGGRPPMTKLERDYQLPGCALERERGADAIRAAQRMNRREREAAPLAQDLTVTAAGGTTSGEQHGAITTRRVLQGSR
jgi:hypothetical protein